MTCHEARDLFSALIDETLTREQRADVYGHLTTCAECRRELTALERTVALVRGATPVRAPAGFVDRVLAAARPVPWYVRVARAALLPWPVKVPLGAAAVVLVAGLAVLMFRGSQEQQQAARHEPRPLSDRAAPPASGPPVAPSMPAAPPPASAPEVTSRPRADSAPEADRAAGVASRVEEEGKREQAPAALESRDKVMAKRAMTQSQPASAPDVVARLETPDRDTAERGLAALVARLTGEIIARHFEGEAMTVELAIPADRYEDFIREAGRIGTLRVETERPAQAGRLRILVHFGTS